MGGRAVKDAAERVCRLTPADGGSEEAVHSNAGLPARQARQETGAGMGGELARYRAGQAHAYLERIRQSGEDCAGLRMLVDDARYRASGLTGIDCSEPAVSSSPTADAIPDGVDGIISLVRGYAASLAAYERKRDEARKALRLMPSQTDAKVLMLRYLLGLPWEHVCVEMGYTYDGVMKARRRALADFYGVMPHSERDPVPPAV